MSLFEKVAGTIQSFFQFGGPSGAGLSNASGPALEVKDSTDTSLVNMRGADPVGPTDFVTKQYANANYNGAPHEAIVWRPGAVGVLPSNVVATWPALMTLFASIAGPVTIAVDVSLGAANVPVGVYDMQSRAYFMAATIGQPASTVMNILDGGQLVNVARFQDMVVRGHGTGVNPLAFTTGGLTGSAILWLVGARVSTQGTAAMIATGGTGYNLTLLLNDNAAILAGLGLGALADVGAGDAFTVYAFTGSIVWGNSIVANAASLLQFTYDGSVVFHTQAGDASGTWLSNRNPLDGPGTVLVWQPGATGVLARNLAPDWPSLMALFGFTTGPVTIAVDTSLGVAQVPAGLYDMQGRASFVAATNAGVLSTTILSILDNAQLINVASFDQLVVQGNGATVSPLAFTTGGPTGASTLEVSASSLSTAGAAAMVTLGGTGYTLTLLLRDTAAIFTSTGPFANVGAGDSLYVYAFTGSSISLDCLVGNATATFSFVYDGSVVFPTQVGDASGSWLANRYPLDGPGPVLVWQPGGSGLLPRNVAPDWPSLMALFALTTGDVLIEIDQSLAPSYPAPEPVGVYDFQNRATFTLSNNAIPSGFYDFDISDGVQLRNVAGFKGPNLLVRGREGGSGVHSLGFDLSPTLRVFDGAAITNFSSVPMIALVSQSLTIDCSGGPAGGGSPTLDSYTLDIDAASTAELHLYNGVDPSGMIPPTCVSGSGALTVFHDLSAPYQTQSTFAGAVTLNVAYPSSPVIIYREAWSGVQPANVATTWAQVMALFGKLAGPVTITIDTSTAPTNIPVGVYDFENRATFEPYQSRSNGGVTIDLNIPDGAQLQNVSEFRGVGRSQQVSGGNAFHVIGNGSVVNPLAFAPSPDGCELVLSDHVTVVNLGAIPMVQLANGDLLYVRMETGAATTASFGDAPAGSELLIEAYTHASLGVGAVSGAGTTVFNYDMSVLSTAQAGASAWNATLLNPGILKGQLALAAGTSGVLSAPGLSASSVIAVDLVTPAFGAGNLTRWFIGTTRVYGAAGSFVINALDAAGVLQGLDGSTVEYTVTL